jgi:hypothetical protein
MYSSESFSCSKENISLVEFLVDFSIYLYVCFRIMDTYDVITEFNKKNRTIFRFIIVLSIILITLLQQRLSNSVRNIYQKTKIG